MAKAAVRTIAPSRVEKNPSLFTTLQGWWSADNTSQSQTAGAKLVGNLPDKSTNNRAASIWGVAPYWQATSGPTGGPSIYKTATENGLKTVNWSLVRPVTYLAVAKITALIAADIYDGLIINTGVVGVSASGSGTIYSGASLTNPATLFADFGWHVIVGVLNGASSLVAIDGGISTSGNSGTGTNPGGVTFLSSSTGVAGLASGYWVEGAVFNEAMSLADITQLGRWAADKYGLPWDVVS